MKKKLFLIIFLLIILSGCGKKEGPINEIKEGDVISNNIEVKLDDKSIFLDSTGSFNSMNYRYPSICTTSNLGTYSIMDYMDGSEFVFRIALSIFEKKSIEEAMNNSSVSFKDIKKVNSKEWYVYEGKSKDNKNTMVYAYNYNGDTYTITFVFDKDIKALKDAFINTIFFN